MGYTRVTIQVYGYKLPEALRDALAWDKDRYKQVIARWGTHLGYEGSTVDGPLDPAVVGVVAARKEAWRRIGGEYPFNGTTEPAELPDVEALKQQLAGLRVGIEKDFGPETTAQASRLYTCTWEE